MQSSVKVVSSAFGVFSSMPIILDAGLHLRPAAAAPLDASLVVRAAVNFPPEEQRRSALPILERRLQPTIAKSSPENVGRPARCLSTICANTHRSSAGFHFTPPR